MSLLSLEAQSEVLTNKGRIDAVLFLPDTVYIFELKLNSSAEDALQQIGDKGYYQKFLGLSRPLILVGLSFHQANEKFRVSSSVKEITPSNAALLPPL